MALCKPSPGLLPLEKHDNPSGWPGDLSDVHAFTVRYRENEDRMLDSHVDSSDVTLNLCLGGSFEGGEGRVHLREHLREFVWFHVAVFECLVLNFGRKPFLKPKWSDFKCPTRRCVLSKP